MMIIRYKCTKILAKNKCFATNYYFVCFFRIPKRVVDIERRSANRHSFRHIEIVILLILRLYSSGTKMNP